MYLYTTECCLSSVCTAFTYMHARYKDHYLVCTYNAIDRRNKINMSYINQQKRSALGRSLTNLWYIHVCTSVCVCVCVCERERERERERDCSLSTPLNFLVNTRQLFIDPSFYLDFLNSSSNYDEDEIFLRSQLPSK